MPKCPLYQSQPNVDDDALNTDADLLLGESSGSAPSCQHRSALRSCAPVPDCRGEFTRCAVQFDDQQLSNFVADEIRARRVEFIFNPGDDHGVIKIEKASWPALELIRRFGKRQTQGIETILTVNNNRFQFSADNKPVSFGDAIVFPLDTV